jgi:hypothetical protein
MDDLEMRQHLLLALIAAGILLGALISAQITP